VSRVTQETSTGV